MPFFAYNKDMNLEKLKNKKYVPDKLKKFGFKKSQGDWVYKGDILNGDFKLTVTITEDKIKTELIETETSEPYTLHLVEGAEGKFVGKVRSEYEKVMDKIAQNCYEMSVFEFEQSLSVLKYAKEKYGSEAEYLWEKFPRNAVCRRNDNKKWYFAVLSVKADRLGFDNDEIIEVIDLRAKKEAVPDLLKQDNIYPAYHMNKKSWITIVLDNSMDTNKLFEMIDTSYELAK